MIWWIIFLAVILVLVGIAYLRGKCDGFIAGYNTSILRGHSIVRRGSFSQYLGEEKR